MLAADVSVRAAAAATAVLSLLDTVYRNPSAALLPSSRVSLKSISSDSPLHTVTGSAFEYIGSEQIETVTVIVSLTHP